MPRRAVRSTILLALACALVAPTADAAAVYRQPLLFEWTTAKIDVLVFPPHHGQVYNVNGPLGGDAMAELNPYENSYMRAVLDSIDDVGRALTKWGSDWFLNGLDLNIYLVGRDTIPQDALTDPDVLVIEDENKAVALGLAVAVGPPTCVVLNSMFFITSMTYQDMYNINAQEYMHCLGLAHVNEVPPPDAPNPDDENMRHDPLNGFYSHNPGAEIAHLHCPSNLNVRGIEEAFRREITGEASRSATVATSSYERLKHCGPA